MKTAGVAELKARLSAFLKEVERGESIVVLDRKRPIARLVPYAGAAPGLPLRKRRSEAEALHHVPLPAPLRLETDVVELLLEDRQGGR